MPPHLAAGLSVGPTLSARLGYVDVFRFEGELDPVPILRRNVDRDLVVAGSAERDVEEFYDDVRISQVGIRRSLVYNADD